MTVGRQVQRAPQGHAEAVRLRKGKRWKGVNSCWQRAARRVNFGDGQQSEQGMARSREVPECVLDGSGA